jgi:dienelactone hydrolase
MPDILNGDPLTDEMRQDPTFDRAKWFTNHGTESWTGVVDKVVEALKAEGVSRIGAVGFCFGAPPVLYLALKNSVHVSVLTHPSRLAYPEDLEVEPCSMVLCAR